MQFLRKHVGKRIFSWVQGYDVFFLFIKLYMYVYSLE